MNGMMIRWEYQIGPSIEEGMERPFNERGSEGWELVTAGDIKYGGEVFKRPYKLCPDNTKS